MPSLKVIAITACLASACAPAASGDSFDASFDASFTDGGGTGCDGGPTYADFGAAFLGSNCNSCHAFSQATAQSEGTVLANAVSIGYMPPGGGGVSASARAEFSAWVRCGAP